MDDGFVNNLLQLCVFQVVPYHHLQHLEQFSVGDVAVLVHVIDLEGNCTQKSISEPQEQFSVGHAAIIVHVTDLESSYEQKGISKPVEQFSTGHVAILVHVTDLQGNCRQKGINEPVEQFSVGDVAVFVRVSDLEGNCRQTSVVSESVEVFHWRSSYPFCVTALDRQTGLSEPEKKISMGDVAISVHAGDPEGNHKQ